MKNEHRVVTPESVEFVYELAGLGSRMAAVALDHLLILGLFLAIWIITAFTGLLFFFAAGALVSAARIAVFLVAFGYFAFFEWRWNGQTPGKRLLDLRVIDDRGMNADLFQSLVRNLFRLVDMMPMFYAPAVLAMPLEFLGSNSVGFYAIGGLAALLSRTNKRLGDWAAGTLVVRTQKRVMPSAILAPEEKFNTFQEDAAVRSRIRARLTLEERETLLQLCLRRSELEFPARQSLFAEAAEYLERKLEIRREPFMSHEKFVQNITAVSLGAGETRSLSPKGATAPPTAGVAPPP